MTASSIHRAALQGDVDTVRAHCSERNTRTAEGYTPLGLAVSAGHEGVVRVLLREGVDVDAADFEGTTPLMHAAMHGYCALVDLLLLHGASAMLARADGSVRYFTVRESARLQTFPDSYRIEGVWSEAMRQLGNAVPVTLAERVARSVAGALENSDTTKQ